MNNRIQLKTVGLVLPFADHITTLSEDGRIVKGNGLYPTQRCNSDLAISAVKESTGDGGVMKDKVFGLSEHSVPTHATNELNTTTLDAARRTSDTSVYLYYARAAGLMATVCFLSVTMACTFCESLAGELHTCQ